MAVSRLSQQSLQNSFPKGNTVWDGTTTTSAFDTLGSVLVGSSGQASITFSNIPQTYTHLQVRGINLSSSANNFISCNFNGDNGNNYSIHAFEGTGVAANSYYQSSYGKTGLGLTGGTTTPGAFVMDILDYTNTGKNTMVRGINGNDANGTSYVDLMSSAWNNTAAVTSIVITHGAAVNFNQYSRFSLYGIK